MKNGTYPLTPSLLSSPPHLLSPPSSFLLSSCLYPIRHLFGGHSRCRFVPRGERALVLPSFSSLSWYSFPHRLQERHESHVHATLVLSWGVVCACVGGGSGGGVIMFCSSKSHVSWVLYTNTYARWCHLVSEQCSELCCEYRRSSWLLVTRLGPTPFVWTWPLPKPITGWCTGDSPTT